MTEREAWQHIGEAFERYAAGPVDSGLVRYGLCHAIGNLDVSDSIRRRMLTAIQAAHPEARYEHGLYMFPSGRSGALDRALLCYFLAESTDG